MRTSLSDPQLEHQLREDGYVVVDLLDDVALAELRGFWAGMRAGVSDAASADHTVTSSARPRADERVRAVLTTKLERLFDRHRPVVGSFVARTSAPDGEAVDQLGWSMVDETTMVSCGVWAPLIGVDQPDARVTVTKASHRAVRAVRGTPELPSAHDLVAIADRFDPRDRLTVGLRAGQALIYDHRLIHSFGPGLDGAEQAAVTVAMVPREARLFHHHLHQDGRVERFAVDDRFHLDVDPSSPPAGQLSLGYVARELAWTQPAADIGAQPTRETPAEREKGRRVTFLDPDLQAAFERDGYVKVPLVSDAELARLTEIFTEVGFDDSTGFHASIYSNDQSYKRAADAAIKTVLEPAYARWLDDHRSVFANFLVKAPDDQSEVGVHQDWTFVDEDTYASVNVWCPLADTDEINGTLRIVPGSHRCVDNLRGTPIESFPSPFAELRDTIMERDSIPVSVRVGEAIIADNRLVHASAPNRSDQVRVVAGIGAAPAEAEQRHVYRGPSGTLELYRVEDPDFFNRLVLGERPDLELLGTYPDADDVVTQKDLDRALGRRFPADPQPIGTAPGVDEPSAGTAPDEHPSLGDVTPEPTAAEPGPAHASLPRLRRRVWNLLNTPNRERAYALAQRLPGPVRARLRPPA